MTRNNENIWYAYNERIELFEKSDQLSVKVGLISVPILFVGVTILFSYILPEDLQAWIQIPILISGLLLFIFILLYARKLKKKKGHVLIGRLVKITSLSSRGNVNSKLLKIHVKKAYELNSSGKGKEIESYSNKSLTRVLVLQNPEIENDLLNIDNDTHFLCVSGGQIIAFAMNGNLTRHLV